MVMMITEKKLKIDPDPMPVTPYQPQQATTPAITRLPRQPVRKPTPAKPRGIKKIEPDPPAIAHMRIVEGEGLGAEHKPTHRTRLTRHRFRITLLPFYLVIAAVVYAMASGPYLGFVNYAAQHKRWVSPEAAAGMASIYEPFVWAAERSGPMRPMALDYMAWWVELYTSDNTTQVSNR